MFSNKRNATWVVAFLAVATVGMSASAGASTHDVSMSQFVSKFPGAKFVADKDVNRFYIVRGFATKPLTGDIVVEARQFIEANAALFGVADPAVALRFDKIVPHRSSRFVRFDQMIDGLPVFGVKIIAHINASNSIVKVSSKAVEKAPNAWESVLDKIQAYEYATRDIPDAAPTGPAALGYLPVQGQPFLVYEVATPTPGPHLWISYVNAITGQVVMRFDAVRQHKAKVYEESPTTTPNMIEVDFENIVTEGDHVNHTYGAYARVASCTQMGNYGCDAWEHLAVATAENGFLDIAPEEDGEVLTDAFAELMVYYAIDKQSQWVREEFGFDGQFGDAESYQRDGSVPQADYLWILVNLDYQNGAFSGGGSWGGQSMPDTIILGNIFGKDLAYDNDVAVHEFTHAMSSKAFDIGMGGTDELGMNMMGMGVEEGNADYFAISAHGNPLLGEYSGVTRNAENDHICPDDIQGEGHYDGEIISGGMWEIRQELGKPKADHLQYLTLAGHPIGDFQDYGEALIAQAEEMADPSTEIDEELRFDADDVLFVKGIVAERNLIDCERLVPLTEDMEEPLLQYMMFGFGEKGTPSTVQYYVETDDDMEQFTVRIAAMGEMSYDVYVREGEPIYFTWSGSSYYDITWEAEYDASFMYDDISMTPVDAVKISNITEPQLKKNTRYYFSISCKPTSMMGTGCRNLLSLETSSEPEEDPNGGDSDTDTDTDADTDADSDTDTDTNTDPNDIDGDGIPNDDDDDIDGDGTPNDEDDDMDGDGTPNDEDDDMDGDGTPNDEDDDTEEEGDDSGDCGCRVGTRDDTSRLVNLFARLI